MDWCLMVEKSLSEPVDQDVWYHEAPLNPNELKRNSLYLIQKKLYLICHEVKWGWCCQVACNENSLKLNFHSGNCAFKATIILSHCGLVMTCGGKDMGLLTDGTNSIPESMPIYCQLDPSIKLRRFETKHNNFHSRKYMWKWHLQNGGHFVQGSIFCGWWEVTKMASSNHTTHSLAY